MKSLPGADLAQFLETPYTVESDTVQYTDDDITAYFEYDTVLVSGGKAVPQKTPIEIRTKKKVPKTGLMLVGWGGNNGTTVTASLLANKHNITWKTKAGERSPDYYGSMVMSSTVQLGTDSSGRNVYVPFRNLLPMVHPNDLELGGWDLSSMDLGSAMKKAQVLDVTLQEKLKDMMSELKPLPGIYTPDFIAANQSSRVDNCLKGTLQSQLETICENIRDFKASKGLERVVVMWTATTERFCDVEVGLNDTADNLLLSIKQGEKEVSASSIYAVASVLEGCTFVNGSPQNTFVPGLVELAQKYGAFLAGDDFKSGQTKIKSVLVDFLISSGIKPVSIVSYNHLGNNDGRNLSAPKQFRSKEISKSNVVDQMVVSNRILYDEKEHPDHVVVIKYVPAVQDSKRALDEYTSDIFMGGRNTIAMHNTCEDSLLASPLILDLAILAELSCRITFSVDGGNFEYMHPVLSILSYMLKAPAVPDGTPVVNALFAQRQCLVNLFRVCTGLPSENFLMLEHKLTSQINPAKRKEGKGDGGILNCVKGRKESS